MVVVRGPGPLPAIAHPGPVVVSGRDLGPAVQAFALGEARIRQWPLHVLYAHSVPPLDDAGEVEVTGSAGGDLPEDSSLFVLGRRGEGHLSSEARHALGHAACPVAIVP